MCVCTVVLVLDGEAEDVAGPEARAIVHAAVEERVRVGILDVEDLTRGGHMACNALVCRDPELLLQPRRRNVHVHISGTSGKQQRSIVVSDLIGTAVGRFKLSNPESYLLVTYDAAIKDFGHQLVAETVQQEDGAAARGRR